MIPSKKYTHTPRPHVCAMFMALTQKMSHSRSTVFQLTLVLQSAKSKVSSLSQSTVLKSANVVATKLVGIDAWGNTGLRESVSPGEVGLALFGDARLLKNSSKVREIAFEA